VRRWCPSSLTALNRTVHVRQWIPPEEQPRAISLVHVGVATVQYVKSYDAAWLSTRRVGVELRMGANVAT